MTDKSDSRRHNILRAIAALSSILPGSLQAAYTKCGKAGCRCTKGRPHGPSHRLICRRGGKATSVYVPPAAVPFVEGALRNRKRLERLIADLAHLDLQRFLRRR